MFKIYCKDYWSPSVIYESSQKFSFQIFQSEFNLFFINISLYVHISRSNSIYHFFCDFKSPTFSFISIQSLIYIYGNFIKSEESNRWNKLINESLQNKTYGFPIFLVASFSFSLLMNFGFYSCSSMTYRQNTRS